MRVLIVEDDPAINDQVAVFLREQGHVVDVAADGDEGLFAACEYPIDVAVIDWGLPGLSGLELIEHVRANGHRYPILILTARGRWQDKVEGLESGADDYLVKPFHSEELLARLKALVRRAGGWADPVLACGPVRLDTRGGHCTLNGEPVELTAYEYRVLEYMMLHAGEVVSKTAIGEHIYEEDDERDSNTLEVFVRRLRLKLDPAGTLKPIETLRGRGYRWTLERDGA